MINANEVRIGNILNLSSQPVTVSEIYKGEGARYVIRISENNSRLAHELDHFNGIPITEEWLIRFGFEPYKDEFSPSGTNMRLQINGTGDDGVWLGSGQTMGGRISVLCVCYGNYFANNMGFVHQLQNLYHSLTGQELELKD